ncbi:glycosyltransferase [Oscillatoria sp. FACHB-1407]|uniref:glycosyltransferase n=1 Tax=Oscillatoria sp. FACHB-1407 TaxID=2692847 RepID=UPI0016850DBB|nr:glycosyltransferase [Oscillatoria sp. FACHB-1407]MBD2461987.1 glycosyltransferase [Oscillatoria sp. FACHB-1407]
MTHYGILCLGGTGHLNTMLPLGAELQRRGHSITVFSDARAERRTIEAGFNFRAIGSAEVDPDRAKVTGLRALFQGIDLFRARVIDSLREAPVAIQQAGIEALLVDMSAFEGGAIADSVQVPFITVCSSLMLYQDNDIPPTLTTWSYNPIWYFRLRNWLAYKLLWLLSRPVWSAIADYRKQCQLPPYSTYNDCFSKLATISHQVAEIEFPRRKLPPNFHFTGPFHSSIGRSKVDFPFEQLNSLPLIYVSLGTSRNRIKDLFSLIAEACATLDVQLVIALGGGLEPEEVSQLPGNPIVVKYAPQLELLKRASLCITHAGLNTVLESLNNAVPLVAIPLADDQLGVAARIAWSGAGELLSLSNLDVSKLRNTVQKVLNQKDYKRHAVRLQSAIHHSGGVKYAADIIEEVITQTKMQATLDLTRTL